MRQVEVIGQVRNQLRPRPKAQRKPSETPEEQVWDTFTAVLTEVVDRFGDPRPAFQPGSGIGNHTLMDERMDQAKLTRSYQRVRPVAHQMLNAEP